jgi:hypothetical protein
MSKSVVVLHHSDGTSTEHPLDDVTAVVVVHEGPIVHECSGATHTIKPKAIEHNPEP